MDQISQLKAKIESLLEQDISLYDVKWTQDGKMKILQVAIMKSDGSMDIDTCAEVSMKISDMLDCLDRSHLKFGL